MERKENGFNTVVRREILLSELDVNEWFED